MKNHSEVIEQVFRRRDEYEARKKQKRRQILSSIPAVCVCLIALAGAAYSVWFFGSPEGSFTLEAPVSSGLDSAAGSNHSASSRMPVSSGGLSDSGGQSDPEEGRDRPEKDVIQINRISRLETATAHSIALRLDDQVELSWEEALAYYGTQLCPPNLPKDLNVRQLYSLNGVDDQEKFVIYKRLGGTGEVYCDMFNLHCSSENSTRFVHISGYKDHPLPADMILPSVWDSGKTKVSKINGQTVLLALEEETGRHFAKFTYRGVSFQLTAQGLTQEEVVLAVKSLLK